MRWRTVGLAFAAFAGFLLGSGFRGPAEEKSVKARVVSGQEQRGDEAAPATVAEERRPASVPPVPVQKLEDVELGRLYRAYAQRLEKTVLEKIDPRFPRFPYENEEMLKDWQARRLPWIRSLVGRSRHWIGEGSVRGPNGNLQVKILMSMDANVHSRDEEPGSLDMPCYMVTVLLSDGTKTAGATDFMCDLINGRMKDGKPWRLIEFMTSARPEGHFEKSPGLLPVALAYEVPRDQGSLGLESLPSSGEDWVVSSIAWRVARREELGGPMRAYMIEQGIDPDAFSQGYASVYSNLSGSSEDEEGR